MEEDVRTAEAYAAELSASIASGSAVPVAALEAAGSRVEAAKAAVIEASSGGRREVSEEELRTVLESGSFEEKQAAVRTVLYGAHIQTDGRVSLEWKPVAGMLTLRDAVEEVRRDRA